PTTCSSGTRSRIAAMSSSRIRPGTRTPSRVEWIGPAGEVASRHCTALVGQPELDHPMRDARRTVVELLADDLEAVAAVEAPRRHPRVGPYQRDAVLLREPDHGLQHHATDAGAAVAVADRHAPQ